MAQAAVADVAAEEASQSVDKIAQKAIAFLDQDVISWSRSKTTTKISENGRREVEEVSKWSIGVKVWELGIALMAVVAWEAVQIFKEDLSQLENVGSWIEGALGTIASDAESGIIGLWEGEAKLFGVDYSAKTEKKKLPAMPAMSAMAVLDAQLGVMFAQILGPINLSGGQIVNGLIAGLAKKGGVVKGD